MSILRSEQKFGSFTESSISVRNLSSLTEAFNSERYVRTSCVVCSTELSKSKKVVMFSINNAKNMRDTECQKDKKEG